MKAIGVGQWTYGKFTVYEINRESTESYPMGYAVVSSQIGNFKPDEPRKYMIYRNRNGEHVKITGCVAYINEIKKEELK